MADLDERREARRAHAAPARRALDVAVAAVLLALAVWAVYAGVAAPWRTPALAVAVVALALVARRRALWRAPEQLVVALGAVLAGIVLLGAALALSPVGVSRQAWAVVLAVVGVVVLAVAARRPVVGRLPRVRAAALVWGALTVLVAAAGLGVAVHASRLADAPPLQMWVADGDSAVELRAPGPSGPYDLWLEPVGGTPVLLSSGLNLPGGEVVRIALPDDVGARAKVVLRDPAGTDPVRTLIVDPA